MVSRKSWGAWRAFLAALFGLQMSEPEATVFRTHTGRQTVPTVAFREAWLCCGRRAGKSLIAAFIAVYLAFFRDYTSHLAPGELATVMIVAADRRQARVILRYRARFRLRDSDALEDAFAGAEGICRVYEPGCNRSPHRKLQNHPWL